MCKAVIEQGANKGKHCDRPELENGYCGKHQKQANTELNLGNKKCPAKRCNNFLSPDSNEKYCVSCMEKKTETKNTITLCKAIQHQGETNEKHCGYKAAENGYCGKHQRQVYYDKQKERGIRYCDIDRGCFAVLENGFAKCDNCLRKKADSEKKQFITRTELNDKMNANPQEKNTMCVECGKEFEKYETNNGKLSKRCAHCNNYQKISASKH
jgi:hypothetical protein